MKPARFLLAAEQELSAAATFYEDRAPGLGQKFIASVEHIVHNICVQPHQYPSLEGRVRRAIIHGFPYSILFINTSEEIAIVAIMHDRRRPFYWAKRA
jgi:plasmid stabilization system protein ParE